MKNHFLKRLLTVIITFVVIFLLGFIFIIITPGNAALGILKAKESLLVLAIFLFILFLIFTIFY